jgi:hypothetical protein
VSIVFIVLVTAAFAGSSGFVVGAVWGSMPRRPKMPEVRPLPTLRSYPREPIHVQYTRSERRNLARRRAELNALRVGHQSN